MEKHIQVDIDFLKALVEAAAVTALNYRGMQYEEYVLGQLEATANVVYAMSVGAGDLGLESACQKYAMDALQRLDDINPAVSSDSDWQSDDYS